MFKNKSLGAAIIAAILASVCCVGPLVLLALGISGAWIGNLTKLEPYRPVFMVITAGFLFYAFIKIYRKPNVEKCKPGRYCANPRSVKLNKIVLWSVSILVILLFSIPYLSHGVDKQKNKVGTFVNGQPSAMETIVLSVPDMNCSSCPVTVRLSLKKLKGVYEANVLFDQRLAIIKFNPDQVQLKDLIRATTQAGYPSSVIGTTKIKGKSSVNKSN